MNPPPRANAWSLAFAIVLPSVVTWVYFVGLAEAAVWARQGAYVVGKTIQFAFPAIWIFLVCKERFSFPRPTRHGVVSGLLFGLAVAGAMIGAAWWLKPLGFFTEPSEPIRAKILALGVDSTFKYLALGVFYSLVHSFLEEYYWRWFVYGGLRERWTVAPAVVVSSLGFMAHHVLLLGVYFGWSSPVTYLFSAAVAIGGVVWAWLYERSGSLYGPWLSHLLVDAAIFAVGYDLAQDLFR